MKQSLDSKKVKYRNATIQELQDIKVTPDELKKIGMSEKELLAMYTVELLNNDKFARTICYGQVPLCMVMYHNDKQGTVCIFKNTDLKVLLQLMPDIVKVILSLLIKHKVNDIKIVFKESNKFTQKIYSYLDPLAIANKFISSYQIKDGWVHYSLYKV
jgi:hypothetical protein